MVDTNCNGISGINLTSGLAHEEELCGGSGARGVIYVGDSVGAHFHVPPQWFSPMVCTTRIILNERCSTTIRPRVIRKWTRRCS